jgi:RNA polymerase sigma-B factor
MINDVAQVVEDLAPTAVEATRAPDVVAPQRHTDEYHEVIEMFVVLKSLPPDSRQFARQRERIVTTCLPLADHIARHYDRRGQEIEDLIQVARIGLMNAVNRFDPEKSSSFLGFAVPTMMGEVRRHFRDHGWSMHVPRRIRDRHGQITKATAQLTHDLGRAPTAGELSKLLDLDREEVVQSQVAAASYNVHSIDAPMWGGSGNPRMVADTIGDIDLDFDHITDRESVRPLLAALSDRERTVLYLRFFGSMTQSQIAQRVGVSQMHVSRILERTLAKLRDQLVDESR